VVEAGEEEGGEWVVPWEEERGPVGDKDELMDP